MVNDQPATPTCALCVDRYSPVVKQLPFPVSTDRLTIRFFEQRDRDLERAIHGDSGLLAHLPIDPRTSVLTFTQTLLSEEVTTAAKARAKTIDHEWQEIGGKCTEEATGDLVAAQARGRQGLSFDTLVEVTGFEPVTPTLRT